jgi:hypothetical protein
MSSIMCLYCKEIPITNDKHYCENCVKLSNSNSRPCWNCKQYDVICGNMHTRKNSNFIPMKYVYCHKCSAELKNKL